MIISNKKNICISHLGCYGFFPGMKSVKETLVWLYCWDLMHCFQSLLILTAWIQHSEPSHNSCWPKKKNIFQSAGPAHSPPAPTSLHFYEAMNKRRTRWCKGLLEWDVLVNEQLWICRTPACDPGPERDWVWGLSLSHIAVISFV